MKILILIIIIGAVLGGGYYLLKDTAGKTKNNPLPVVGSINTKLQADKNLATAAAKELWRSMLTQGTDLSQGPCLSNNLIPGWVADIAHNPRIPNDDMPENQCSAYREGQAKHFIELDPEGNFIRAE